MRPKRPSPAATPAVPLWLRLIALPLKAAVWVFLVLPLYALVVGVLVLAWALGVGVSGVAAAAFGNRDR